jgi:hypothetical protein
MQALARPFHELDSFDRGFLLMVGRVRLVSPAHHLGMTLKKMKDIRLWGPESALLRSALLRSWKKHGSPLVKQLQDSFAPTDKWYTVNGQHVSDAFRDYEDIGRKVWADVETTARDLFQMCQSRASDHFNAQRRAAKVAKIDFTESQWASYLSSSLEDHLEWFVHEFPTRTFQPAVQRLVQIVQTNPEFRTIDRAALKDRITALVNLPEQHLSMTGDLHMGRLWSFTGLQTARAEGVDTYLVVSVWDAVTCDVCAQLSGKSFDVNHTMEVVQHYLDSDPRHDGDNMAFPRRADVDNKPPSEFTNSGLIPPFHGRCRCDIVFGWSTMAIDHGTAEPPEYIGTSLNQAGVDRVLASDRMETFNLYSDKWLRGVDGSAKEFAFAYARNDYAIQEALLGEHFGIDTIPANIRLYRVGALDTGEGSVGSFWSSRGAAEAYQARMGVEAIYEYSVPAEFVVPSGSGAGEIWADINMIKQIDSYLPGELLDTAALSPKVEAAFVNREHAALYRQYEADYLEFFKGNPRDAKFEQMLRNQFGDDPELAKIYMRNVQVWTGDPQGRAAMALKYKATQMESNIGGLWLNPQAGEGELARIIESAANITDEQYLRLRAFNQAYMIDQGYTDAGLWRGVGGDTGRELRDELVKNWDKVHKDGGFLWEDSSLTGYTAEKRIAEGFGTGRGGVDMFITADRESVFMVDDVLYAKAGGRWEEEKEWIITGGVRWIRAEDVTLPRGAFR